MTEADKGGKLVLLDSNQYTEMVLLHLSEDAYERVASFGSGKGKVVLFDPISKSSQELVLDVFGEMDPYDKLLRQQCSKLTSILNTLVKEKQLDKEERKHLIPNQPYSGRVPKFYGLPKVHKLGTLKIRPIVSSCDLYCDLLMLLLKAILNLLLWGTTSLANSYDLVNLLEKFEFSEDDILLSFDITSLFTKVPVPETLQIVKYRLDQLRELDDDPIANLTSLSNQAIMDLLDYTLNDCYFLWDNVLFKQKSGVPMGGRLSPILATLFMESLEYSVLCSTRILPRIFLRYVDDIFIVWDESRGCFWKFLERLNAHHPAIQLTVKKEQNRSIPFLDVRITRPKSSDQSTTSDSLQIEIFRKATHANRYLHFNSAHPLKLKENVARVLWLHAQCLLKNYPKQLAVELRFLKVSLSNKNNCYPIRIVNKWFAKFDRQLRNNPDLLKTRSQLNFEKVFENAKQQRFEMPTAQSRFLDASLDHSNSSSVLNEKQSNCGTEGTDAVWENTHQITKEHEDLPNADQLLLPLIQENRQPILIIPYVAGISDQLKRIVDDFEIKTWFSYPGSAMAHFSEYRGRLPVSKTRYAIYQCFCDCGCTYIGESGRNLKVRVSEHLQASSRSAFSDHLQNLQHRPLIKDTVILSQEKNYLKRKIIETICIDHWRKKKSPKICNSGFSSDFPAIWQICSQCIAKQLRPKD